MGDLSTIKAQVEPAGRGVQGRLDRVIESLHPLECGVVAEGVESQAQFGEPVRDAA